MKHSTRDALLASALAIAGLVGCSAPVVNAAEASSRAWAPAAPPVDAEWHKRATQPTFDLPARPGAQPETNDGVPHEQLDQTASVEADKALRRWLFGLPCIEEGPSVVSDATARGARYIDGCAEAETVFPFRGELTHVHRATGLGSLHLVLPTADADEVIAEGWGVAHPWDGRMMIGRPLRMIMVYAPRHLQDLPQVQAIIYRAYLWQTGQG